MKKNKNKKNKKQTNRKKKHETQKRPISGRRVVICGIGLFIVAAYLIWTGLQDRVVVENRSGRVVESATISIRGDRVEFSDIANGQTVDAPLHITTDTTIQFKAQLADGTVVRLQGGYLTNGMTGERPQFVIRPDGRVEFQP